MLLRVKKAVFSAKVQRLHIGNLGHSLSFIPNVSIPLIFVSLWLSLLQVCLLGFYIYFFIAACPDAHFKLLNAFD